MKRNSNEPDKLERADQATDRALTEIARLLGVTKKQALRYIVNEALPHVRTPMEDHPLGRLVLYNRSDSELEVRP